MRAELEEVLGRQRNRQIQEECSRCHQWDSLGNWICERWRERSGVEPGANVWFGCLWASGHLPGGLLARISGEPLSREERRTKETGLL